MKTHVETVTYWEVVDGQGNKFPNDYYDPGSPDFSSRKEAEACARKRGFPYVMRQIVSVNEDGIADGEELLKETIYRVKGVQKRKAPTPPILFRTCSAHAHCLLCGEKADFENGVAAHDWQFMHEVQHERRCVEAWETEAGKEIKIPLRMWVREGKLLCHVLIERPDPDMFSSNADDDEETEE